VSRPWAPADTDLEVLRRQVERWRSMSPGSRAQIANQLSIDVTHIAVAGIRSQHPDATPDDVRRELARRRDAGAHLDGPTSVS
jgi:hypothetical protein